MVADSVPIVDWIDATQQIVSINVGKCLSGYQKPLFLPFFVRDSFR